MQQVHQALAPTAKATAAETSHHATLHAPHTRRHHIPHTTHPTTPHRTATTATAADSRLGGPPLTKNIAAGAELDLHHQQATAEWEKKSGPSTKRRGEGGEARGRAYLSSPGGKSPGYVYWGGGDYGMKADRLWRTLAAAGAGSRLRSSGPLGRRDMGGRICVGKL